MHFVVVHVPTVMMHIHGCTWMIHVLHVVGCDTPIACMM